MTMPAVRRFYTVAVAEGIIKWLPIDADEQEEMEFVCLSRADHDAAMQQQEAALRGSQTACEDNAKRMGGLIKQLEETKTALASKEAELAVVVGMLERFTKDTLQVVQPTKLELEAVELLATLPASARALLDELAHERHQSEVYRVELGKACHVYAYVDARRKHEKREGGDEC